MSNLRFVVDQIFFRAERSRSCFKHYGPGLSGRVGFYDSDVYKKA